MPNFQIMLKPFGVDFPTMLEVISFTLGHTDFKYFQPAVGTQKQVATTNRLVDTLFFPQRLWVTNLWCLAYLQLQHTRRGSFGTIQIPMRLSSWSTPTHPNKHGWYGLMAYYNPPYNWVGSSILTMNCHFRFLRLLKKKMGRFMAFIHLAENGPYHKNQPNVGKIYQSLGSSGIFTYIYHKNQPIVGKIYQSHGWYGIGFKGIPRKPQRAISGGQVDVDFGFQVSRCCRCLGPQNSLLAN